MNKESVYLFLSSQQDLVGRPAVFANVIPPTDLTQSSEVALCSITIPRKYIISPNEFWMFVKPGDSGAYLTVRIYAYRNVQDLADSLNAQINGVIRLKGDVDKINHLIFSVGNRGCLRATPYDKINKNKQWLGFESLTQSKRFASALGFDVDDPIDHFNSYPTEEFEALTYPTLPQSTFLFVRTNLLDGGVLRTVPTARGDDHIIFKERVYKPIHEAKYDNIKIDIIDPGTMRAIEFENSETLAIIHMREANIING